MRKLVLMRGVPGSGKSTLVASKGLKQFSLSPDEIRTQLESPVMGVDGLFSIPSKQDDRVFSILQDLLRERMRRGDFTVVDATHCTASSINYYRSLCQEFRYRCYVVDLSEVPLATALTQNAERDAYKRVDSDVVTMKYLESLKEPIPSWVTRVSPECLEDIYLKPLDLTDTYDRIHHIGDIQGCWSVLKEAFEKIGFPKDNPKDLYIFTGDLVDRGIENAEVVKFFMDSCRLSNVSFIEGNHERWLIDYAKGREASSHEFQYKTKPQLDRAGISLGKLKQDLRTLAQCYYYKFEDKTVLVTHGGLPIIPEVLDHVQTAQMIYGVGGYQVDVDTAFNKNLWAIGMDKFMVHGHRNKSDAPILFGNAINLEGKVEFGGDLRVATLSKDGWHTHYFKNKVFDGALVVPEVTSYDLSNPVERLVKELREETGLVKERSFGSVSSFSFTREAWRKKEWNSLTTKARGLFVNVSQPMRIVARSYDKFFNVGEVSETSMASLEKNLKFPVKWFLKENGYLGIVGYDHQTDSLWVSSKSSINNGFDGWFRTLLEKTCDMDKLKALCSTGKSLVFEVVDMVNDPHIIDYGAGTQFVTLLDAFSTETVDGLKFTFEQLQSFATEIEISAKSLRVKRQVACHSDFREFKDFYELATSDSAVNVAGYAIDKIEGFVIEDSSGFLTKIKMPYYNEWKWCRTIAGLYAQGRDVTYLAKTNLQKDFVQFLKTRSKEEVSESSLVRLRQLFYRK